MYWYWLASGTLSTATTSKWALWMMTHGQLSRPLHLTPLVMSLPLISPLIFYNLGTICIRITVTVKMKYEYYVQGLENKLVTRDGSFVSDESWLVSLTIPQISTRMGELKGIGLTPPRVLFIALKLKNITEIIPQFYQMLTEEEGPGVSVGIQESPSSLTNYIGRSYLGPSFSIFLYGDSPSREQLRALTNAGISNLLFRFGVFQDYLLRESPFESASESTINSIGTVAIAFLYVEQPIFTAFFQKRPRLIRPVSWCAMILCAGSLLLASFATAVRLFVSYPSSHSEWENYDHRHGICLYFRVSYLE